MPACEPPMRHDRKQSGVALRRCQAQAMHLKVATQFENTIEDHRCQLASRAAELAAPALRSRARSRVKQPNEGDCLNDPEFAPGGCGSDRSLALRRTSSVTPLLPPRRGP